MCRVVLSLSLINSGGPPGLRRGDEQRSRLILWQHCVKIMAPRKNYHMKAVICHVEPRFPTVESGVAGRSWRLPPRRGCQHPLGRHPARLSAMPRAALLMNTGARITHCADARSALPYRRLCRWAVYRQPGGGMSARSLAARRADAGGRGREQPVGDRVLRARRGGLPPALVHARQSRSIYAAMRPSLRPM